MHSGNDIFPTTGFPSPDGGGLGRGDLLLVKPKFLSYVRKH